MSINTYILIKNKISSVGRYLGESNMEFNKEKMKQLIHYIVHKCFNNPDFGKTVLYKLLYFSDFNHYEIYETLLTGETYLKKPKGPVPSNFGLCYNELEDEGKINCNKVLVFNYYRHSYSSLKQPDISLLTNEELKVIDKVIKDLSHMNASDISDYSHGDRPWRVAKYLHPLNPEFVFYRSDKYSVREYDE